MMTFSRIVPFSAVFVAGLALAGCGSSRGAPPETDLFPSSGADRIVEEDDTTLWEALAANRSQENTIQVNRYLWNASLDVLNFLPIDSIDPFSGVIVTGFGTPPGGNRPYRATIHVTDPALDARALRVSLQTRNGPVAAGTARAVEDAILARARQMRITDNRF